MDVFEKLKSMRHVLLQYTMFALENILNITNRTQRRTGWWTLISTLLLLTDVCPYVSKSHVGSVCCRRRTFTDNQRTWCRRALSLRMSSGSSNTGADGGDPSQMDGRMRRGEKEDPTQIPKVIKQGKCLIHFGITSLETPRAVSLPLVVSVHMMKTIKVGLQSTLVYLIYLLIISSWIFIGHEEMCVSFPELMLAPSRSFFWSADRTQKIFNLSITVI